MAARIGNLVMTSGMGGDDPKTGKVPNGLEAQTEGCFANMQRMVGIAGGTTASIAHVTALVKEYGKTVLMVTHDPVVARQADLTLHLEKGLLVESAEQPQGVVAGGAA